VKLDGACGERDVLDDVENWSWGFKEYATAKTIANNRWSGGDDKANDRCWYGGPQR